MIEVRDLWKTFRLYHDPKDRLKEIVFRRQYAREYHALKGVSFQVNPGETLGIIGENGAGKSTLLKLLTGIILPTSGEVHVDGHVTGLLELGTGFNSELTGIRNIHMNGLLIGMSKDEIDRKLASIIDFTELGEFIEEPIKTYSSGMLMRLAFAIAIHAEPKLFVVDEALSVGDAYFQQKCMNRIKEFRSNGGSIIFVSHDLNAVKMLCDRAILLNKGEVIDQSDPESVINAYNFMLARRGKGEEIQLAASREKSFYGNNKVEITQVEFLNEQGVDAGVFVTGERVSIRIHVKANEAVDSLVVGMLLRDRFGQDIFGTNSHNLQQVISIKAGKTCCYEYSFDLNVGVGKYTLTAALHRDFDHISECYYWSDRALNFEIVGASDYHFIGTTRLAVDLAIKDGIQV